MPAVPGTVSASGPRASESAGVARRILVVDDNEDAAEGLADYLRTLGHHVRIAFDGATALEEADRHRPELAFLDIAMPRMDGYETARRLRGAEGLASCVLVALTGFGQETDRQLAREAGFDHHLVKPVDVEKLRNLLETGGSSARPALGGVTARGGRVIDSFLPIPPTAPPPLFGTRPSPAFGEKASVHEDRRSKLALSQLWSVQHDRDPTRRKGDVRVLPMDHENPAEPRAGRRDRGANGPPQSPDALSPSGAPELLILQLF